MAEFGQLRAKIDGLTEEIKVQIKKKSISESSTRLEQARTILGKLRTIAKGDIQSRIVQNRAYELESIAKKIDGILSKREAGKREDGNIALKCNWNDKHYQAPCSLQAYQHNIDEGRAWCSSPLSKCREFGTDVNLANHPCYESIALKEMFFGAGWDHQGERNQPRHIHSVKKSRVAILTTRPPGSEERERLIVGCIFIADIHEDPGEETKIFGDKSKSITVDYDKIKVRFWDYYKNAGAEDLIVWASGLFRYVTDETVLNLLLGIGEQYKNDNKDVSQIIELVKHYENLVKK